MNIITFPVRHHDSLISEILQESFQVNRPSKDQLDAVARECQRALDSGCKDDAALDRIMLLLDAIG